MEQIAIMHSTVLRVVCLHGAEYEEVQCAVMEPRARTYERQNVKWSIEVLIRDRGRTQRCFV